MRIAFAGTPEFAVPALAALASLEREHPLVGVLTQPDRPSGRGRRITPSPVKRAAEARGLPVAQPATLRSQQERAMIEHWKPDLLVVVAYGVILPPQALELPRFGCINIHASLLPRWRGAAPIQRAILAGDAVTGVTIMQMDAGLDTGPILMQRTLPIESDATSGVLHDALARLGAQCLLAALRALAAGTLEAHPQPAAGVTYAPKIEKREALIDWSAPAHEIERRVRAFNPWPVAETRFGGEALKILRARPEPERGDTQPGTILSVDSEAIRVQCGTGSLAIRELQRPGHKPLPAGAFLNAVTLSPGERLG